MAMMMMATTTTTEGGLFYTKKGFGSRWLYSSGSGRVEKREKTPLCWSWQNKEHVAPGEPPPETITAVEFDDSGEKLAVGDRGGKVTVFQRKGLKYDPITTFQSHEQEFDYLKSVEIEERIAKIRFLHKSPRCRLLTTNDKTIKLWSVHDEPIETVVSSKKARKKSPLTLPKTVRTGTRTTARCKRVYAHAHAYHVNSISPSADGEMFSSADDLRVNFWHLDVTERTFNVVDLKPANMEDLTEVITSACFHPTLPHIFLFATSKGVVKIFDLRDRARLDQPCLTLHGGGVTTKTASFDDEDDFLLSKEEAAEKESQFESLFSSQSLDFQQDDDPTLSGGSSFFSEIVSSISDARFIDSSDISVVARDFLTVKVWDARSSRPLAVADVHSHLKSRLSDLYDSDRIFDKFDLAVLPNKLIVSGSYSNNAKVVNPMTGESRELVLPEGTSSSSIDYERRVLHVAAHPTRSAVALASQDKVHLFDLDSGPSESSSEKSGVMVY